ncbi:alanine racemase [Nocardioides ginsengisoli]|uniref:Alanine racemase n=1 Tax=Nocardioides ginsengisoli TaxID=363868 RepID=A0ABW3W4S8_9ACTN
MNADLTTGHPFVSAFSWPLAVVRMEAVQANAALMRAFCDRHGLSLAPHIKTTMSPQLTAIQQEAGAWALTVATASQLRTAMSWGAKRFVIANELVDPRTISWLCRALRADPKLDVVCYVDSVRGAMELARGLADQRHRVSVLIEVGHPGGRAGVRTESDAIELGRTVRALGLVLAGVSAYEGSLVADRTPNALSAVRAFVRALGDVLRGLHEDGSIQSQEAIISCGGSAYFDVVGEELARVQLDRRSVRRVLRSGCYLLHDHGFYAENTPVPQLRGSVEVWSQVISHPEPDLLILDAGRRDVGFDLGLPVVLGIVSAEAGHPDPRPRWTVTDLNDQHAYVRLPTPATAGAFVGTVVALGVSHPCTTLDKWQRLAVLDRRGLITDYLTTHF